MNLKATNPVIRICQIHVISHQCTEPNYTQNVFCLQQLLEQHCADHLWVRAYDITGKNKTVISINRVNTHFLQ